MRRRVGIILAVAATLGLVGAGGVRASDSSAAAPVASPGAPAQVASPGAGALVARLAVLRRPQTASDLLPPGTRLPRPEGQILPALTRQVATVPGVMNVYLVVATPTGGSVPLWSPRLGDQVTVVATGPHAVAFDAPSPAADLDDPFGLGTVGDRTPRSPSLTTADNIAILPDGVSRVRWRFAGARGGRDVTEAVPVADNVAIAPVKRNGIFPDGATWYAPDGTVVPTSDAALLRAMAARQAILKARALRSLARRPARAAPSLLAAFAVFSVTSRRPVHEPGAITVARPRPADLPLEILNLISHGFARPDVRQIRAITTRSGNGMWLIPGAHSLCLAVLDPPRPSASPVSGRGAGEACGQNLTQVEAQGIGLGAGGPGGGFVYGVLPRSKPTITVTVRGHRRVIRPPFGVYVLHHGRGLGGPVPVVVSPTGG